MSDEQQEGKQISEEDTLLVRDAIWEVRKTVMGAEVVDQGRIRIRPFL